MDDALEDRLMDELDAFPVRVSGVWSVTLNQAGPSGLLAARTAFGMLRQLGANPVRMVEDLVGRAEIAHRCGTTPQAVGLWMRGERRASAPAPAPLFTAGVDLWLWSEVVDWLRQIGRPVDSDLAFPTRTDHQIMNGIIASSARWKILPVVASRPAFSFQSAAALRIVPAPLSATQFGLAA